ncbi:MAG: UbiX family flavin prenyltransferase [Planctomycetota bacterium]|jgi:4-hydroxy-3-polyprenylbenzoate decarboxylase
MSTPERIIVGITGASGAPYAARAIELMADAGLEVHLVVSRLGRRLILDELGQRSVDPDRLSGGRGDRIVVHSNGDVGATIASGSFQTKGMLVVPCSGNTLGAIASGVTNNLVQRAAAVVLKERRRLVLAHRESPLSMIDLENMQRVTAAGGIIAPLSPGFYLGPKRIEDLVDFVVGRLLDLFEVPHELDVRWDESRVGALEPDASG